VANKPTPCYKKAWLTPSFIKKMVMKGPALMWSWAEELGVELRVSNQLGWAFWQNADNGVLDH